MLLITALLVTNAAALAPPLRTLLSRSAKPKAREEAITLITEMEREERDKFLDYVNTVRETPSQARASAADALRADFLAGTRRRGAGPGLGDRRRARGRRLEAARGPQYAAAAREHSRRLETRTGGAAAGAAGLRRSTRCSSGRPKSARQPSRSLRSRAGLPGAKV